MSPNRADTPGAAERRRLGFRILVVTAGPKAECFYERPGAVPAGGLPDRKLPIREYRLPRVHSGVPNLALEAP